MEQLLQRGATLLQSGAGITRWASINRRKDSFTFLQGGAGAFINGSR